jgi:cubilin
MSGADLFDDHPRIRAEDGGLVLESALNKNLTLRTRGAGTVNINGQDLSSLARGLLRQPEDPGGDLAGRLEQVETSLGAITAGDGRLAALEQSVAELSQSSQESQDTDTRYRRLRRQYNLLKRRLDNLEELLGRNQCSEQSPCRNGGTCINTYNGFFCQVRHPLTAHYQP